jgi:hypothetical protein
MEICSNTGGAMDATVLDMKRCADLFLFSTTFFQAITYSHQTTRKLSLSSQPSSAALTAHPIL